ncbi:MAG: acyltransferase [Chloroflexota bacterium]
MTPSQSSQRLYYLDWIRVLAVFGVFMFHALHAFDGIPWVIKNDEISFPLTGTLMLFFPWGLPLFFMVAGASSYLALKKRSDEAYVSERFKRLFLPFIIGSILLSPIQAYVVALHQGLYSGSFLGFLGTLPSQISLMISPKVFSHYGWHLWFLGYLFTFALITLPLFRYLTRTDDTLVKRFAAFVDRFRGGLMLLLIPLLLARGVHGLFPLEHGWTDWLYYIVFYCYGFMFFTDERFLKAIRRDWWIGVLVGIIGVVTIGVGSTTGFIGETAWEPVNGYTQGSITLNLAMPVAALSWGLAVFALAQARFNFDHAFIRYGQRAIVPFYVLHQPIILVALLYIVEWDAGLSTKIWTTILLSFVLTMLIYEIVIRRLAPLQRAFGMKTMFSTPSPASGD